MLNKNKKIVTDFHIIREKKKHYMDISETRSDKFVYENWEIGKGE